MTPTNQCIPDSLQSIADLDLLICCRKHMLHRKGRREEGRERKRKEGRR
jgi:hypothetical protein